MPREPDATRALFDRWAATYDVDTSDPAGPLMGYGESLQSLDEMVVVDAGTKLLDIGIGTGSLAARFVNHGAQITGIDVSEQMLARCHAAHSDFELKEGSFTEIPFPDAAFDMAVSSFAFHEVEVDRRMAACTEVARVLRPGGQLALLDIVFASESAIADARAAIGAVWDPDEDYPLIGQLDAQLRTAGFVNLRWHQSAPYHWVVLARLFGRV